MVSTSDERRFFSNLIRLTFFAVSLATVVSLFGRFHWFAELFSHFRFYFLLFQAVLALIFLHSQRWLLMTATLILAIPNAWYVGPYLTPLLLRAPVAVADTEELEIVSLNVNFRNRDHAATLAYLDITSPDVIVLSEVTSGLRNALRELEAEYPYQVGVSRPDPWGMLILSRVPFAESELLDLGVAGTVHARVILQHRGSPLQLYAVHLYSPTNPRRAAKRNLQLATLAERIRASDMPTAVVGDLNVTPFSPFFDEFLESAGVVDARQPAGFHFTWPTSPLPLWIPIDHALADPAVRVTKVRRGPDLGSDHYPLEISLVCCEAGST